MGGGSCFIKDTKIIMADGGLRNIQDVVVGDKVQGLNGVNEVIALDWTTLGDRKLYSFNGSNYFVTSEHPFWTDKGWQSINPEDTKAQDGEALFKQLTGSLNVGAKVYKDGAFTELTSIDHTEPNDPEMPLYNFHLSGDQSYFADGWCVHNKGGGGIIKKAFRFLGDLVESVVKIFTSPFGLDITVPEVQVSQDEGIQGVLINKDSGITNVPIVYGTRMVGGARVFVSTNGSDNEYLYVAYVLSEGQCNGYTQLLIDDIVVTPSSYAHGVSTGVSTSPYSSESRLQVQFFDGRDNQVASSLLKEAPGWTDNHTLSGLCYIACRFRWKKVKEQEDADNNPYSGNIPNIKVTLQGKKIYDLTAGYSPATIGSITGQTGTSSGLFNLQDVTATLYKTYSNQSSTVSTLDNDITFTLTSTADVKIVRTITTTSTSAGVNFNNAMNLTDSDGGFISGGANTILGTIGGSVKQKTITYENTFNLPAGDYKIDFSNTADPYTAGTFNTTFYTLVEIIIPEVEDHTVLYENETVSFNNNPANILLDYMRNPRYGKGLSNDAFDWITFRKAALQCDQTVNYTDVTTGKAFTCDAVVQTEGSIMNNCKLLLIGFRGIMPYTQGKFKLKIENAGDDTDIEAIPSDPAVAFTATADNIVGGLQLVGDNKESKINRCRVTYVDPSADYQPNEVIYPADGSADDTLFLSQDNNQRFESSISLPTVASREQALQYAEVFVKRSRNAKQIQFATTIAGSNIAVGDLCRVISENIGLDGIFRITDIRLNSEGDIQITGFEHQPEIYTINAKSADITRPALNLPDPLSVPAPTSLTLTSTGQSLTGTDNQTGYVGSTEKVHRILAEWTATTDPFFDRYVVQYKVSTDTDYITVGTTSDTFFYIAPVVAGTNYDVRVASENELARRSAFVTVTGHTVSA
jgi:hypothetical protein